MAVLNAAEPGWCGCSPVPWVGGFHLAVFPFLTEVSCTLPWLSASPRRPCCWLWLLTSRRPSTRSERTQLWLIPAHSDQNRDSLQYQLHYSTQILINSHDYKHKLTIFSLSEGISNTQRSLESIRSSGLASFHCKTKHYHNIIMSDSRRFTHTGNHTLTHISLRLLLSNMDRQK